MKTSFPVITAVAFLLFSVACGQSSMPIRENTSASTATPLTDRSGVARSNTLAHYEVDSSKAPPPFATANASRPPILVPKPAGIELTLPPGFQISTFAEGDLHMPRWMALAQNGDVFVSEARSGRITILRDSSGNGRADERFIFATDLNKPFGLAFWRNYLYVANTDSVVRFKYKPGQIQASEKPEIIATLPGEGFNQHWTRNIIFSPDGSKMYVTVGSETNVEIEQDPMRATISEYNPDGTGHRLYANGLRNPVGLAFYPGTRMLWAVVQERDGLGDDLVPDFVTSIKEGGFYGWPYSYLGQYEDPRRRGERPDLVQKAIAGDVLLQAHSSPLGLVFYQGNMFPSEYRGDAFIALRGSWNRAKRTGYKIIRIQFNKGKPIGGYSDFIVGWMLDEDRSEVWGRPVGLLVLRDGSLLISDDGADKIWRVSY